MTKLSGSPFDSLSDESDLFAEVESRGIDLVAAAGRRESTVTYVNFGPTPRNPFDDYGDGPHSIFGGPRPRGPLPPSRTEVTRKLANLLSGYIRDPRDLLVLLEDSEIKYR